MLYLNQSDIEAIGIEWEKIMDVVHGAAQSVLRQDFVQPVKPYLRFNDLTNRIIAMPAYLGGPVDTAGLKWVASFPQNIQKGVPRAHSVTLLNDAATGKPYCIINTNLISSIRTAGVSGLMLRRFLQWRRDGKPLTAGIVGYGPIGQMHARMLASAFGTYIEKVYLYDLQAINESSIPHGIRDKTRICNTWQEAYADADVFITCTVSKKAYIDEPPKKGSLQLNVSLRDYLPACRQFMDVVVVDDWDEVCRENTDIEVMHKTLGLRREDTVSLARVVCTDEVSDSLNGEQTVMFNPMGMAVFDIALGFYYRTMADQRQIGTQLEA